MAEIKVSYRSKIDLAKQPRILSPGDAEKIFRKVWDGSKLELREDVVILALSAAKRLIGWIRIFSGGLDRAVVDAKLIFQVGLNANAVAVIVAHNHPSGELEPSRHDLALTKKLVQGGRVLDIEVDDHCILTRKGFHSIREHNPKLWRAAAYKA
jgi:DNA repair protein RadC